MKNTRISNLKYAAAPLALGLALISTPSFAQDAAAEEASSEIIVTGSLITNPNLERSAPVNSTSSEEMELLQSNLAEELLREIPGVVASIGSAVNNGNGGASYVNLRGIGSNRNVVLLDGDRIVPAGFGGQVDLNNIPLALVERVDVLTGGASTTYGADAVGGVVNFILKNDFSGLEAQASQQLTEKGDGNVFRADVTIGANFDDGRGNAVFGIGYQQAAIPFLVQESTAFTKTSLAQVKGTINGDAGVTSPFAEEPVAFAVGGEFRKYTARQGADALAKGGDLGGAGGATPDIKGGFDVYEAFGEVVVPVASDKPYIHSLTVEGGLRYSSYTVDAPGNPSYNTTTFKAGGTWEPVEGLAVRGNFARAVRAPNIGELFSPVNTGLTNLGTDPCATLTTAGAVLPGRPATGPTGELRAVCLAQGANLGNIGSIPQPNAGQVNSTGGGNVNIKPETSDSFTIGAIFQPAILPGFTASLDYYKIKVTGAISSPTPGDIIAACFGTNVFSPVAGASTSAACTSIRRSPADGSLSGDPSTFTGLPSVLSNAGAIETDGIDLIMNYKTDLTDKIGLALSFNGNYTFTSTFNAFVANPESVNRDCTGYVSSNCGSLQPDFSWSQRTTLSYGKFDVSLLWRHLSAIEQEPLDVADGGAFFSGTIGASVPGLGGQTLNFGKIKAYDYFDLSARINASENLTFTVSAQNLLDKDPPVTGNNAGSTSYNSGNTFPSTYDALGRRYAVTAKLRF